MEAKLEYGDALVLPGNVFHSGMQYRSRKVSTVQYQTAEEQRYLIKSCFCVNDEKQLWKHNI